MIITVGLTYVSSSSGVRLSLDDGVGYPKALKCRPVQCVSDMTFDGISTIDL